jgi:hypothetical protein
VCTQPSLLGKVCKLWLTMCIAKVLLFVQWHAGMGSLRCRCCSSCLHYNLQFHAVTHGLCRCRCFLSASPLAIVCRDAWFEVPLPFFLRDAAEGLGWSRPVTGAFLAVFIIVYGQVRLISWRQLTVLQHERIACGQTRLW